VATFQAEPFTVGVSDRVLADLRARIQRTRWPEAAPGVPWEQGTDLGYLRELLASWAGGFDWHAQERRLNGFRHFRAEIDGIGVHFVHERARSGHGIPLILTHGWPSCFAEFLPLVPWLTDPAAHGIGEPGFDVVIPSLPFVAQLAARSVNCSSAGLTPTRVKLGLDNLQVQVPDVGEDAAHPPGGVVPSLARGSGTVVAAAHRHEHGRLAGQDGRSSGGHAGVGDNHVDPGLEVLRDAEVVERDGEQQRIGRDELVGQGRGERQRGPLLVRA
jgi:hypothetical protein